MAFPSTLSSFSKPTTADRLNSPSHSGLHNTVSSALGQVEAVIGVDGANSVLGTIMSDLRNPDSGGGGHVQTTNKGGTGQTVLTKGDILVAQSSSVLSKLAVGNDGQALVANSSVASGVNWGIPNVKPTIIVYSVASVETWTKPANLSYIEVELVAGGASGDGDGNQFAGDGGGAGGYAKTVIVASNLGVTEVVTIGVGGIPSVGGGHINGGFSGFGSHTSVLGGNSRTGGIATSGDIKVDGSNGGVGHNAANTYYLSGLGGSSPFGSGGSPTFSNSEKDGDNASVFGAGGSGIVRNAGTPKIAGSGKNGIVIVTEY